MNMFQRWRLAQQKEDTFWKRRDVLQDQMQRVKSRYLPIILMLDKNLGPDSRIIDIGCGPTGTGRFFLNGEKFFVDPLLSSYIKTYQGFLPTGWLINAVGEDLPFPNDSFDISICVNALDHMLNSAKVVEEIRRVLKPTGILMLGIFLHPEILALIRRSIEQFFPFLKDTAHPHSFTKDSIVRLLQEKGFEIQYEQRVYSHSKHPRLHRTDWVFLCKK